MPNKKQWETTLAIVTETNYKENLNAFDIYSKELNKIVTSIVSNTSSDMHDKLKNKPNNKVDKTDQE